MFVVSLIMLSSAFLICTNRLDWALEIKRLDVDCGRGTRAIVVER